MVVQARREKAASKSSGSFSVHKVASQEAENRPFNRPHCYRTRGNSLKLNRENWISYKEEMFYAESGQILAMIAQRNSRCPFLEPFQVRSSEAWSNLL